MGLIDSVRRVAFARPHLLVLAAPGATETRIAVERVARERGWPLAASPADADALVEAGVVHGDLAELADLAEHQLPAPSSRLALTTPDEVEPGLAELPGRLASWRSSEHEAVEQPPELSMAERAEDRDGLMLDVLRVPLGPLLPHWPAGLRLVTRLQGDVIQHAEVEVLGLDSDTRSFWAEPGRAAPRRLDAIAALLGVAGWTALCWRCRSLRDRALAGEARERLAGELETAAARIRRSRLLRSELTGLGMGPGHSDAAERLHQWLDEAMHSLREPENRPAAVHASPDEWLDALPEILSGAEVTAARLIVASIGIDVAELEHASAAGAHHD